MYAYETQICYYNNVKYFARINFHFYHLAIVLWGIFFLKLVMGRYLQILLYIINENVQMSNVVFFSIQNLKGCVKNYLKFK
jgi:hypothetical protein